MQCARLLGPVLLLASAPLYADPFLTRNQNPLLAGFALPLPAPAEFSPRETSRVDLVANWSNTASSGLTGNEALLIDLESRELRLLVEHSISDRYALRLQLPYRHLSGGILDGFIDGWHQALELPEGARKFLERDQFQVGYIRNGITRINLREPVQGMGDVAIEGGVQLLRTPGSAVSLWVTIEAPTGSARDLLGNGSWDAGLQAAGKHSLSGRSYIYWHLGTTYMGTSEYLGPWQHHWIVSASGTFEYAALQSLHLKAQLDAHTAPYDSGVDFLSNAVILTVGGDYRFASGFTLNLGIGEDIDVGSSPDVNFVFSLSRSF